MTLELTSAWILELIDTLNDLSGQIKTDFGGYKLISKLFISGILDKIAADNLAKKWKDFKIYKWFMFVSANAIILRHHLILW